MDFAIIKHRIRAAGGLNCPPDTAPMQSSPKDGTGKGSSIPVLDPIRAYMKLINSDKGYQYAMSIGNLWINDQKGEQAERIGDGGNFVSFDGYNEADTHGHVRAFSAFEDPALVGWNPAVLNWRNYPALFWKACAICQDGKVINVANNLDVYYPYLRDEEDLWIALSEVEPFPRLPAVVTVGADGLNLRSTYAYTAGSAPKIGSCAPGSRVTIYAYRPVGCSVWGWTGEGWVALLYNPTPAIRFFTTSWKLATTGVVPPLV